MEVFVQAVLAGNLDDGAVSQKVARALDELELRSTLEGKKGPVHLPAGTYAGSVSVETESTREAITVARQGIVDRLSEHLADTGFVGTFFVTAAQGWCWGTRPVPRNRTQHASDSSRVLPAMQGKRREPYPFAAAKEAADAAKEADAEPASPDGEDAPAAPAERDAPGAGAGERDRVRRDIEAGLEME